MAAAAVETPFQQMKALSKLLLLPTMNWKRVCKHDVYEKQVFEEVSETGEMRRIVKNFLLGRHNKFSHLKIIKLVERTGSMENAYLCAYLQYTKIVILQITFMSMVRSVLKSRERSYCLLFSFICIHAHLLFFILASLERKMCLV